MHQNSEATDFFNLYLTGDTFEKINEETKRCAKQHIQVCGATFKSRSTVHG